MPRTVSLLAMRSALAQESESVWICLLEISHPNMAETIYLCDNSETITHNSIAYLGFPFKVILPSDETEREPSVKLGISNVDQRIIDDLRSITSGPTITLKVVLAGTPDTIEYGPVELKASSVMYNAQDMQLTLAFDSLSGEPLPWLTFNPEYFPGIFTK